MDIVSVREEPHQFLLIIVKDGFCHDETPERHSKRSRHHSIRHQESVLHYGRQIISNKD
jgi:hypothetical protein